MKTLILSALVVLSVAACDAKKEGAGANGGDNAATAKLSATAVADANAAIPDALKTKLKFVEGAHEDRKLKAPAVLPEGWKTGGVIPGSYKPDDNADLGFMTKYELGTNCDGACEAKDWAAVSENVEFAQFKGAQFTVTKDEKTPGFRILIATTKDGTAYIRSAFWKAGANRYFTCGATLDPKIAAAAPAFEKACRAFTPVW